MSLNIEQLREEFKQYLRWSETFLHTSHQSLDNELKEKALLQQLKTMSIWSISFERNIENHIRYLEKDLQNHPVSDEYFRSITESLADLDRLRRTQKTLEDILSTNNHAFLFDKLNTYYHNFLIPLFNILAKLENDYQCTHKISAAKQSNI